MKILKVQLGEDGFTKTVFTEGEHTVSLDVCVPNDWNMNKMAPDIYEKTKLAIKETKEEAGRIPPIVVRPLPGKKRKLQIIDGEHRWRIHKDLGYTEINVDVSYVGTKRAMLMTPQLNYDRGEPDMEKYPAYFARMMETFKDVDPEYLAARLPDSEDEITSYLDSIDFEVESVKISDEDEDEDDGASPSTKDASSTDALVELKFAVRQGAGEVIEKELARLGAHLGGGKNVRGRALEVMAVLSSQTPDASITSNMDDEDGRSVSVRKLNKKHKKKLKKS